MRCLAITGFCALIFFPGNTAVQAVSPEPMEVLEVRVKQVAIDPNSLQPIVLLTDAAEDRALLIWIGQCEASAMAAEMEGARPPRPSTHDLAERILEKTGGKVQKVTVTHSKGGVYYATLVLEREGKAIEIDARPSDSIVLALKFKAPIFVSQRLFAEMAIPLKERKEPEERYGLTTQDLTRELAQSFSYRFTRGVLIADVREGSQAEKDGLKRGDILMEMAGKAIDDVKSLKEVLRESKAQVETKVFRKGTSLSLTLNPGESSP